MAGMLTQPRTPTFAARKNLTRALFAAALKSGTLKNMPSFLRIVWSRYATISSDHRNFLRVSAGDKFIEIKAKGLRVTPR